MKPAEIFIVEGLFRSLTGDWTREMKMREEEDTHICIKEQLRLTRGYEVMKK